MWVKIYWLQLMFEISLNDKSTKKWPKKVLEEFLKMTFFLQNFYTILHSQYVCEYIKIAFKKIHSYCVSSSVKWWGVIQFFLPLDQFKVAWFFFVTFLFDSRCSKNTKSKMTIRIAASLVASWDKTRFYPSPLIRYTTNTTKMTFLYI